VSTVAFHQRSERSTRFALWPAPKKFLTREPFVILSGLIRKTLIHGQYRPEVQVGFSERKCLQRYAPTICSSFSRHLLIPTLQFNHVNNLQLIARAHQLVNEGYKYHFQSQEVVTVWSAPNYCYRCGNVASIMTLGEDLEPDFKIFSAVPDHRRAVPAGRRGAGEYFL
jgi:diadenosine tetraphosphatase ApaH/serine/threonine PP2A family protein phosphatase